MDSVSLRRANIDAVCSTYKAAHQHQHVFHPRFIASYGDFAEELFFQATHRCSVQCNVSIQYRRSCFIRLRPSRARYTGFFEKYDRNLTKTFERTLRAAEKNTLHRGEH